MKILTKKQIEALFDDLMVIDLIANESTKQQMIDQRPSTKDLIRQQRIIIERCANVAFILKGMFGLELARQIHLKYNESRLSDLLKKEASNDILDKIDKEG